MELNQSNASWDSDRRPKALGLKIHRRLLGGVSARLENKQRSGVYHPCLTDSPVLIGKA